MNKIKIAWLKGYRITTSGNVINKKGKSLKGYINIHKNGYKNHRFSIRINGKSDTIMSHRLQAYIKFGDEIFNEKIEVRHLNGNSLDNSYDNILIGTHSENMMDIDVLLRKEKSSKANLKYNHKDIIIDRDKGMKYSELMIKYNISSKGTISHIINKSFSAK